MVGVAQLVRASDCGSEGRGFEPRFPPQTKQFSPKGIAFFNRYEGKRVKTKEERNTAPSDFTLKTIIKLL